MSSDHTLYVAIGFPGSGKSHFKHHLINNHGAAVIYYNRDGEVKIAETTMSKTQARTYVHNAISNLLRNFHLSDASILYYDSVNSSFAGRQYLYGLVHGSVKIHLIYFEPPLLIQEGKYSEYVDWLHNVRPSHECFPSTRTRAMTTISNIAQNFDTITEEERSRFTITRFKSFLDISS